MDSAVKYSDTKLFNGFNQTCPIGWESENIIVISG